MFKEEIKKLLQSYKQNDQWVHHFKSPINVGLRYKIKKETERNINGHIIKTIFEGTKEVFYPFEYFKTKFPEYLLEFEANVYGINTKYLPKGCSIYCLEYDNATLLKCGEDSPFPNVFLGISPLGVSYFLAKPYVKNRNHIKYKKQK